MNPKRTERIKKFSYDFLTIFISVLAAFALTNWGEKQKDRSTEISILSEIDKGLKQDFKDLTINESGHQMGLGAVIYFRNMIIEEKLENYDSLAQKYSNLFRTFISVQNNSGYETLKSKGLDIVQNDSLRSEIIALYENDYRFMKTLEEDYAETQFHKAFYSAFNTALAPSFSFDTKGNIIKIELPLQLAEKDKKILLGNLWTIQYNRIFMLQNYHSVKEKIGALQTMIEAELKNRN